MLVLKTPKIPDHSERSNIKLTSLINKLVYDKINQFNLYNVNTKLLSITLHFKQTFNKNVLYKHYND